MKNTKGCLLRFVVNDLDLLYGLGRVGDVTREMIFYEELDLQRRAPKRFCFAKTDCIDVTIAVLLIDNSFF